MLLLLHIFSLILPLKQCFWIRKRQTPRLPVSSDLFKAIGISSGLECFSGNSSHSHCFQVATLPLFLPMEWFFLLISVALIWLPFSFLSGANYFNHFWNSLCRKICQLGKQWCFQLLPPHASNTSRYSFYSSSWVELCLAMSALPLELAWPHETFTQEIPERTWAHLNWKHYFLLHYYSNKHLIICKPSA